MKFGIQVFPYYVSPTNSRLIVKNQEPEKARKIFDRTDIKMTGDRIKYLDGVIGRPKTNKNT